MKKVSYSKEYLKTLPYLNFNHIDKIDLSYNCITLLSLTHFPQNLRILKCNHSYISGAINSTIVPRNIQELHIDYTKISSFDGNDFPNLIILSICNNSLKHFAFPPNIQQINIISCKLEHIPSLPESLIYFNCSNNELRSLNNFPEKLTHVDCSNNQIEYLPDVGHHIQYFVCNNNMLSEFLCFPNSTKKIYYSNNSVKYIRYLPRYLQYLDISSNYITVIMDYLPYTLTHLFVNDNKLMHLPNISTCTQLKHVDISKNIFEEVPDFPPNIDVLNISENCIDHVPDHIKYYARKLILANCSSRIVYDDKTFIEDSIWDLQQMLIDDPKSVTLDDYDVDSIWNRNYWNVNVEQTIKIVENEYCVSVWNKDNVTL